MRHSFVLTVLVSFGLLLPLHDELFSARMAPPSPRGNLRIASFEQARVQLRILYAEHPVTLYSGCLFSPGGTINYGRCGYQPRRPQGRAMRIEWEHVVPAWAFGHNFVPWRHGHPDCIDSKGAPYRGRRCAQKVSAAYRLMEGDLYNLYPEIGEINQLRSNLPMDAIDEPVTQCIGTSIKIGRHGFEPGHSVKGDVARTYLYMSHAYPGMGIVSGRRKKLFLAWARMDPVDAWECRRASRIQAIQGNVNAPVRSACIRAGLWPDTSSQKIFEEAILSAEE